MAKWPLLPEFLYYLEARAQVSLVGPWRPPAGEDNQGTQIVLVAGRTRLAYLYYYRVAPDEDAPGENWAVTFVYQRAALPITRRLHSDATAFNGTTRGFEAHASPPIQWQVISHFHFPETTRSLIALPVTVEDEWATDVRGMRFVKMADGDDPQELYSVIVDRPQRDLTHQVGFVRPGPLGPDAVARWIEEAESISNKFVVLGEEPNGPD